MRKKVCSVVFIISLLLLSATAEMIWTIPICIVGIVVSAVVGGLWKNTENKKKQVNKDDIYYTNHDIVKL